MLLLLLLLLTLYSVAPVCGLVSFEGKPTKGGSDDPDQTFVACWRPETSPTCIVPERMTTHSQALKAGTLRRRASQLRFLNEAENISSWSKGFSNGRQHPDFGATRRSYSGFHSSTDEAWAIYAAGLWLEMKWSSA